MYAVIATGGKQTRVAEGDTVEVELLSSDSGEVTFTPVLLVDGTSVLSRPDELAGVTVAGRVVGQSKGPKITGFTYRAKARGRKRWGHRQKYSTVEITGITRP